MTATPPDSSSTWVLVPIKAFSRAKGRLAPDIDRGERAALARVLAEGVVRSAAPNPVAVVCDDVEVARWAESVGATALWTEATSLDGAVSAGLTRLGDLGVRRVAVVHGDLARPAALRPLLDGLAADPRRIVLVPDAERGGTNVLVTPTRPHTPIAYGPGSFERHRQLATTSGFEVRVVADPDLGWDVDQADQIPPELRRLGYSTAPSPAQSDPGQSEPVTPRTRGDRP